MPTIIPREQSPSFQRWKAVDFETAPSEQAAPDDRAGTLPAASDEGVPLPGVLPDDADPSPGEPLPPSDEAAPEPPPTLPTAAQIEAMFEKAREQGYAAGYDEAREKGYADGYEKARQEGYADGYDEAAQKGRAAGYDEGMAAGRAVAERLETLMETFDRELAEIDQGVAEQLLATSVEIAGQVVRQTLSESPQSIVPVVAEAIKTLRASFEPLTLIAHPDDAKLLREHFCGLPEHREWRVVENPSIAPGGCRVELFSAEIDATLETRWRRVLESIGIGEKWPS